MFNPLLYVLKSLFLIERVTKQQLMTIRTTIKGADRADIAIISISKREVFVDVYPC